MIPGSNPHQPLSDQYFMHEALVESLNGLGWTTPNPLVGCVLVRDGSIIGRGHHHAYGGIHAEVMAIASCAEGCRGATAYVNLEPCTHVAHQGACSVALQQAGIARVVYAAEDSDQRTAGNARAALSAAGIEVTAGVLREQSDRLLDYYHYAKVHQHPFVHLKLALSLDARLACANGSSQWLSGPHSLGYAHFLRQKYDAVLVGIGTVLADNPRLTSRPETMEAYFLLPADLRPSHPVRVILDPQFRSLALRDSLALFNTDAGGFRDGRPRVIVAGLEQALPQSPGLPEGVELAGFAAGGDGRIRFRDLFEHLWRLGLCCVLVEGGARLAAELLSQRQVRRLSLVYTPKLLGADGLGFTPAWNLQQVGDGVRIEGIEHETLGDDVLVSGYLAEAEAAPVE